MVGLVAGVPLKRAGRPEEIDKRAVIGTETAAATFLDNCGGRHDQNSGSGNRYSTLQRFRVCGGWGCTLPMRLLNAVVTIER
jgi:hypothetical protein